MTPDELYEVLERMTRTVLAKREEIKRNINAGHYGLHVALDNLLDSERWLAQTVINGMPVLKELLVQKQQKPTDASVSQT